MLRYTNVLLIINRYVPINMINFIILLYFLCFRPNYGTSFCSYRKLSAIFSDIDEEPLKKSGFVKFSNQIFSYQKLLITLDV